MKKILIALFLLTALVVGAEDIYISGSNEAEYVYKTAKDSLKNYFEDELNVNVDYKNISFGLTFNASLPKYDDQSPIDELNAEDISYAWEERYLSYSGENVEFKVGTLEDSFGTGLTMRVYEDEDVDHDNRLEGFTGNYSNDYFKLKAIYGSAESKSYEDKNESLYGTEFSANYDFITIGGSAMGVRELILPTYYSNRKIYGSSLSIMQDYADFYGEYAYSDLENSTIPGNIDGHAIYANTNFYLGDITITGSYKNFENFDYRFNDLPTLNYNDEPLDDYVAEGSDEEGALGEITWDSDFGKLFASYAEAWSSDYNYRLTNGYFEVVKEISGNVFTFEYDHFERLHKSVDSWSKELTPAILADIPINSNFSMHVKTEYELVTKVNNGVEIEHIEPLLQTDFLFNKFAISIITEAQMESLSDTDDAEFWVGGEFKTSIMDNTDITIFGGKQKGGKVCRNGTCKEVKPFEGIKIEITTKF